ncbi:hypothetical protein [Nocardiopsis alba]|uniref:hypothetical protein n=1 Tax=Nocardiopsis alba TaxID=53437 RepID=UPI0033A9A3C9
MKDLVRAALALLGIRTPTGGHLRPRDHGDDIPVMLSPGGPVKPDLALHDHLHRLERAIREAARHVDDDSRALGMMDAADMIRAARPPSSAPTGRQLE